VRCSRDAGLPRRRDGDCFNLQGDDDQILPFADSGLLQSKRVKDATLKVYKGAPHGLRATLKDQVYADLLAFIDRKELWRAA